MNFEKLELNAEILKAIEDLGYSAPTSIQQQIIPLIIKKIDVLGQSQTGTGKTLAYAAPILSTISETKKTQVLILAPTRELAIQIGREIEGLARYTNLSVMCVYGSSPINTQINMLKNGTEIVVGTPGRIKDLIGRKALKLNDINYFVLDEADEMLSMGFSDEIEYIFDKIKTTPQVLLFSATMPKEIKKLGEKYMKNNYETITIKSNSETADNIMQYYYLINDNFRFESMCRVLDYYNPSKCIIFCRTKKNADDLSVKLVNRNYNIGVIHGDIAQSERIATLDKFKAGKFNFLIATDVASRGIHVNDVDLIINYNLPESNEAYIHRIGRTGRANKNGIAVTFIKNKELSNIRELERKVKAKIQESKIPTYDDIMSKRKITIISNFNQLTKTNPKHNMFGDYIESLSKDEINYLLENLLQKELVNSIGSDFKVNIELTENKKKNRISTDSTRVFMTIGKMDQIEKRELLNFIEKTSNVPESTCFNVEIMTKFTFMSVQNKYYEKVVKSINNINYKDRTIRIEKAKK